MRHTFIETIRSLARSDKDVWLVTGDLGYGMVEPFVEEFPDRFLNVGVAEQAMVGVAAGLALAGKKVFVYSISTFATMRPYEQIRNDVCYQNLPVFIIGGGSAFSYSLFGCSHLPLEDLGIMNILPNMVVIAAGDPIEVKTLVKAVYKRGGPAYIRLARNGEPTIHNRISDVELGKATVVHRGNDASIFVSGRLLPAALEAAEILSKKGILTRVLSMHTIKPIDEKAIVDAAKQTKVILTCEEHLLLGGLGSIVASILVKKNINIPFVTFGIPDEFPKGVGWQDYFLKRYKLTSKDMVAAIEKKLSISK